MLVRLLAFVFFAVSSPAFAVIGTIDNVPGSTLLYPHFEVDTSSANGVNTILTLQNASASATMVNVVLWTDYGIPTEQFNVYLTGYDQETIDLGLVFRRVLPRTGSAGQDPSDTVSPHGPVSQDINFASCNGTLPDIQNGSIVSRDVVGAHSGKPSNDYFGGLCGSRDHGDNIARGYVTMDVTNQCTIQTPAAAGYFVSGGGGVAGNRNILFGDYVIVNPSTGLNIADNAVAIEADASNAITASGANKQTFYGRFLGFAATDNREPLPTAWAGRASAGRTDVDYWREPAVATAPFACGSAPAGLPSGQRGVALFNAAGTQTGTPAGDLFPFVSGSTTGAAIGLTDSLGWLFANLNLAAPSGPLGLVRQSWVTFRQTPGALPATGAKYSVPGVQLGNAGTGDDPTP
ncbi:hypothetical protein [Tahibacter soli]|uniref:Uncharacterized protein n=1 Tax=Tahibacter soli TaxID=2983605 RepID=A0A9X4BM10_9GAMM|nr:hypothetical protein [Tahibacter soli]MDC8014834.1 hypothetical protein [Tahibacter soli]